MEEYKLLWSGKNEPTAKQQPTTSQPDCSRGSEACRKGPDGWCFTPRGAGAPPKADEAARHGFTVHPGAAAVRIVHAGDNLPKIWLRQALREQQLKGPVEPYLHGR